MTGRFDENGDLWIKIEKEIPSTGHLSRIASVPVPNMGPEWEREITELNLTRYIREVVLRPAEPLDLANLTGVAFSDSHARS